MTDETAKSSRSAQQAERRQRLAAELRTNLRRRKEQARERAAPDEAKPAQPMEPDE